MALDISRDAAPFYNRAIRSCILLLVGNYSKHKCVNNIFNDFECFVRRRVCHKVSAHHCALLVNLSVMINKERHLRISIHSEAKR